MHPYNVLAEMHLFDSDARDEEALCKAEVSIHDLNAVQDYLDRRRHGLSVPTVCEPCKVPAVRWAENHRLKLEADTGVYLAKAENLRKRDAVRYRKSVEEAEMEADRLLHEAEEYRRLADRLARETGLARNYH